MRFFECKLFVVQDLRSDIEKLRNKNFPYGWRGRKGTQQSLRKVPPTHVVMHQTDGSPVDGPEGPMRTAKYTTANPWFKCKSCGNVWEGTPAYPYENCSKCGKTSQNLGRGAGMPSLPYHVYVSFRPKRDEQGRPIIYYCTDFDQETWHASSGNRGVGCAFQGIMRSRFIPKFRPAPGTDGSPSQDQQALIYPIWDLWLKPLFKLTDADIKGHFDYGKAACPGDFIEDKIREKRGEHRKVTPEVYPEETSEWFDTWFERQAALVSLGYDCGKYGKLKNGVDGSPGDATRQALEAFQRDMMRVENKGSKISDTGQWDPATEAAMDTLFKESGKDYADLVKYIPEGAVVKPTTSEPSKISSREEFAPSFSRPDKKHKKR